MEEFQYRNNRLYVEEVSVADIARRFGTPVYVYSRRSILDHCRHIERALGGLDHLSCYAVKANDSPEILRLLAGEGIGADVASLGELRAALREGFPAEKITYSGVGKQDGEIAFGVKTGILSFNVESEEELDVIDGIAGAAGNTANVLLRVNLDLDAGTHPYMTTGHGQTKFGIEPERIMNMLPGLAHRKGIRFLGIHTHIGSQVVESGRYTEMLRSLFALVADIRDKGLPVKHVNIGGGFGVQYRNYVRDPLLPDEETGTDAGLSTVKMIGEILPMLRGTGCKIILQPGRSIVAHAGALVTRIVYRKETSEKTFLIADAGMNDLIRPSLYQAYHQIVPEELRPVRSEVVDVVGPLCETGDFLALDRRMPLLGRGDLAAVLCAGAYGRVLSSNYNGRPCPAEVLVDGSEASVIRREEFTYHGGEQG